MRRTILAISTAAAAGTGTYRHIGGSGTFFASIRAVFPRAGGGCSPHALPEAFQLVIRASGPVTHW